MAEAMSFLGTLTIASSGTDSNVLSHNLLQAARRVIITAPATLTGTITVRVSPVKNAAFAACLPLRRDGAAAVVTVAAGQELHVDAGNFKSIAVVSSGAEGGARAFQVHVVHEL